MNEPDSTRQPTEDRPVLKHFLTAIKANANACRKVWDAAEENHRFASGGSHQWDKNGYEDRLAKGMPAFSFNDVTLATRSVSGREMTARFEPTFLPKGPEDGPWCEVLRSAIQWLRRTAGADNTESEAFRDLTIQNISVVEWKQVFDGDEVRGRTQAITRPIWEYMWDTRATQVCLTDRQWDARGYRVNIDEFLMMFPGQRDKVRERLNTHREGWVTKEAEVAYRHPWMHMADKGQYIWHEDQQIFLADYIWREREGAYTTDVPIGLDPHPVGPREWARIAPSLGLDPTPLLLAEEQREPFRLAVQQAVAQGLLDAGTAEMLRPRLVKMRLDEFEEFMEGYAQAFGVEPEYFGPENSNYRWVTKKATLYGEEIVRQEVLPFRNFPRIFMTAVPIKGMGGTDFQSVVEMMKDPQKFKNFVVSLATSHLQRSTKMGLISREGTFVDDALVSQEIAKPFFHLQVKSTVPDVRGAVEFIDGAGFPPGLDRFLDMADSATWRPTGMNPNTLGNLQDPRRVSGTVFQALADAVMTVLSWEFNSFQTYRRLSGELLLDFLERYYEPDDIREIVGPTKAQDVPEKERWRVMLRRDVVVEEVPVTRSEKERQWDLSTRQGSIEKWVESQLAPPWIIPILYPDTWITEEIRQKWLQWLEARGMGMNSGMTPPEQPPAGDEAPPAA